MTRARVKKINLHGQQVIVTVEVPELGLEIGNIRVTERHDYSIHVSMPYFKIDGNYHSVISIHDADLLDEIKQVALKAYNDSWT